MTSEKIRALIEQIAAANYANTSQFENPSWSLCTGKKLWLEDAHRALKIAMPEIIEWCAQLAEQNSSEKQTNTAFVKGQKFAAAEIRRFGKK